MSKMENQQLFARFEGGAIYTAEADGQFLVLVNEAAVADFLEDSHDSQALAKPMTFSSNDERADYLQRRYGRILAFQRDFLDE